VKIAEFEALPLPSRRRFLKLLGAALAGPAVAEGLRYAVNDSLAGAAYAQAVEDTQPTYFIEINMRDQVDYGHLFVAPGLAARVGNLRTGDRGSRAALYCTMSELVAHERRVYLTDDSRALAPHLDSIAMIDTCELSMGAIHGHESANATRSPGRSYSQDPGKQRMWEGDPVSNFPQGCEAFYSSTPTPASLHNHRQKQLDASVRNGIAFKGISRSIHTAYHFAAGLPGAELDRIPNKQQLFTAFPSRTEDLSVLPRARDAELVTSVLDKIDRRFLARRRFGAAAQDSHAANVAEARRLLHSGMTRTISLPLTPEEEAYWGADVPAQVCDRNSVKAEIWEQVAYAYKLIAGGMTRSVALEFDYVDVHDERSEQQMRTHARQAALPLARLIEQLKASGHYARTLIAIYTTDGGRSPAAGSAGNEGKNTVIYAGGMIRGGYYGDVSVAADTGDGHRYAFHAPDPVTGEPGPGVTDNSQRVPGAALWRTAMRALQVPDALCDQFPDVRGVAPLAFMLRA
jgi:hypothetical protein